MYVKCTELLSMAALSIDIVTGPVSGKEVKVLAKGRVVQVILSA